MKRPRLELPLRTAIFYLLFGGLWILLSDQILFHFFFHDPQETTYQTIKGWGFVLISGILIYALLHRELAGRAQTEEALRNSQSQTMSILNSAMDAIITIDTHQQILMFNPAAEAMFRCSQAEALGQPLERFIPQRFHARHTEYVRKFAKTGQTNRSMGHLGTLTAVRSSGEEFPVEASISKTAMAGDPLFTVILRDVTQRKQAERQMLQLKRLYATLSQVNQTIVRVQDQQELFDALCKVAVEFGEFRLAWIGLYDQASGRVNPVAEFGAGQTRLPFRNINANEPPYQNGLIGLAARSGIAQFSSDIQTDPRTEHWQEVATRDGYHSAASVPIYQGGEIIAFLNLYAADIGFFTVKEEQNLLEEMGLDISFALDMMSKEAERKRAEQALQLANARFQHMIDANIVGISIADLNGQIMLANDYYLNLLHATRQDLQEGKVDWKKLTPPEWEPADAKAFQQLREHGVCQPFEKEYVHADGRRISVYVIVAMLPSDEVMAFILDISARKQAEEALRENEERLRLSLQAANQGLYDLNVQTGAAVVNREYAQMLGYDPATFVETNAAWIERLHPDDRDKVATVYSDYVGGLLPEYRVEFRQKTNDGSWKWILSLGKVIEYDTEGKPLRMLGTHTDITERKAAEEKIQSRSRQLAALLATSQSLTESLDRAEILQKITDQSADILGVKATAIYLAKGEHIYLGASTPELPSDFPETLRRATLADHPHIAEALSTGQPVIVQDTSTVRFTPAEQTAIDKIGLNTILYVPLTAKKDAQGVLILGSVAQTREFSRDEIDLARAFSSQAALAMTNANLYDDLAGYARELESQIAERKTAEEALRASEERFRLLFENNHTVMMLIDPVSGSIRSANRAAAEFYGYPLPALCSMNINEINQLPPEQVYAERMRALKEDRSYFNFQHRLASGESRSVEVHSAPVSLGGDTLLFSIVYDITERRQAEEKLRRHINYLTGLREVDQAIASSFDVRLSLNILTTRAVSLLKVDAAAILLLDPVTNVLEQGAVHGFQTNIPPKASLRLSESYAGRAVLERRMVQIPNLNYEPNNYFSVGFLKEEKFVSYYGVPLMVKGKVVGVMEVFHRTLIDRDQEWFGFLDSLAGQAAIAIDNARLWEQVQRHARDLELRVADRTAALNRINGELEHANRAKDEFLANMSHELRTPLNSILGLAESLLEQRRDPLTEYQQKSLEIISSSGHHLLELINDILDLSKIEAGKFDHYPQAMEVDALCRSSLAFVKSQAVRKSITLTYDNKAAVQSMLADPRRLKQILVNLLTNAVKFTPEQGQVTLQVQADAEQDLLQFSVIDTGIGIAAHDLKRLFQPFVQVDSKLNRQFEGTGLGLALVQKLTDLHGGSVEVESKVGAGSRFTINLPWGRDRLPSRETAERRDQRPGGAGTREFSAQTDPSRERDVILLAEDNPANILTIGEYLGSYGYRVVKAHDGLDAIEQAEKADPKLILMDIQMPVMDGLDAIRRLRANPRFGTTPIIAITALAMPGDRERCMEAGANEYMSKPVNLKALRKTILTLTGQTI